MKNRSEEHINEGMGGQGAKTLCGAIINGNNSIHIKNFMYYMNTDNYEIRCPRCSALLDCKIIEYSI